jgi:hypothetical protein
MAILIERVWLEATRLTALHYRGELAAIRAFTPGHRGGRPPKSTWPARKLALHLTVEASGAPPGTVARALRRYKGGVYAALAAIAAERAADRVFDFEVCALELRMQRWRGRTLASMERVARQFVATIGEARRA